MFSTDVEKITTLAMYKSENCRWTVDRMISIERSTVLGALLKLNGFFQTWGGRDAMKISFCPSLRHAFRFANTSNKILALGRHMACFASPSPGPFGRLSKLSS